MTLIPVKVPGAICCPHCGGSLNSDLISFGGFTVQETDGKIFLSYKGEHFHTTQTEAKIIAVMIHSANRFVSMDYLMGSLNLNHRQDSCVRVHIYKLRKKLQATNLMIETVHMGYRLTERAHYPAAEVA